MLHFHRSSQCRIYESLTGDHPLFFDPLTSYVWSSTIHIMFSKFGHFLNTSFYFCANLILLRQIQTAFHDFNPTVVVTSNGTPSNTNGNAVILLLELF